MTDAAATPLIVVGVDGSPEAAAALEIAIEEARLRHGRLHVTYAYPTMGAPLTGSTAKDYYAQTEHEAEAVLARCPTPRRRRPRARGRMAGVPGNPAEVLIEAAEGRCPAGGRLAGSRWVHGPDDRLGVQPVRAPRALPGARRPQRAVTPGRPGPGSLGGNPPRCLVSRAWCPPRTSWRGSPR